MFFLGLGLTVYGLGQTINSKHLKAKVDATP